MTDLLTNPSRAATDPDAIGAPCGASGRMTDTTALRAIAERATPENDKSCGQCGGNGEWFGHAPDCHNDDCVLAGGIDDCDGQVEQCACLGTFQSTFDPPTILALLDHIDAQSRALEEARAERDALVEAQTPSGDTKAAYIGQIKDSVCRLDEEGEEEWYDHTVSWDATKATMSMIRARAASQSLARREGMSSDA